MKFLIIEDEIHNMRMLKDMIHSLRPDWEFVDSFESISESVEYFKNNDHPKVVFMDIQLTDGVCFSIFDRVDIQSMIIFTTAYDNYAIKAFKVNSIDYLLKPIKESELEKSILKFENYSKTEDINKVIDYEAIVNALSNKKQKHRSRFLISTPRSYFKIDSNDIAYFYIDEKTTFLVTYSNKEYIIDFTMEKLENQLDQEIFFRVNRNCIVNINSIDRFEDYFNGKLIVILKPPFSYKIIISRLKATAFKKWVGK